VCGGASIGGESVVEGLTIVPPNVHIREGACIGRGVNFVAPVSEARPTIIFQGATIGGGAIIGAGVSIGVKAVIASGSLVQRSIPALAIVEGSPARIVGYLGANPADAVLAAPVGGPVSSLSVRGVHVCRMPRIEDIRGNLTVGEFERSVPFPVRRYFIVFDVPSMETRGEHAHRECHQFLICVRGSLALLVDDGVRRQELLLNRPEIGIHLEPMVWGVQYKYSADAMLLVFASHYYDGADYIREYEQFCKLSGAPG
jgi:hypothetical protein